MLYPVYKKASKFRGQVSPATLTDFVVDITSTSITIFKTGPQGTVQGASFNVGEQAEYDSYNFNYLGTVTKVTDKAVTIVAYKGTSNETVHRLNLYEFCWRNFNFNLEKINASNYEVSMSI